MAIPKGVLRQREAEARKRREGSDMGPSIWEGRVRYLSTSQLDKADASVFGGCPRRWWLRYKARRPEPEFSSQKLGTLVHAQLEHYLRTGEDTLGPLARAGWRFLPRWNDDGLLRVEWGFANLWEHEPAGSYGLILSPLVSAGVPFVGFVDLLNLRGEWLDSDGVLRREPGVPEVLDHKTTAQIDTETNERTGRVTVGYAKTPEQLASGWQMTTYGLVVLEDPEIPAPPAVRCSHGYYQTRGERKAQKRSMLVPAGELEARRGKLEQLVEDMKSWAGESDCSRVPAALDERGLYKACEAYRGCPYKDECPRDPKLVLASSLGRHAKKFISDGQKDLEKRLLSSAKAKGKPALVSQEPRVRSAEGGRVPAGASLAEGRDVPPASLDHVPNQAGGGGAATAASERPVRDLPAAVQTPPVRRSLPSHQASAGAALSTVQQAPGQRARQGHDVAEGNQVSREDSMSLLAALKKNKPADAPAKDPAVEAEKAALLAEEAAAGVAPPDAAKPSKTHEPIPVGSSVKVPTAATATAAPGTGSGVKIKVEASCGCMCAEDQVSRLPGGVIKHIGCDKKAAEPEGPKATGGELCPHGQKDVELGADAIAERKYKCACGAAVKVKPVKMGEGKYQARVPAHTAGESEPEKPSRSGKRKEKPAEEPKAEEKPNILADAAGEWKAAEPKPGQAIGIDFQREERKESRYSRPQGERVHLYLDCRERGAKAGRLEDYAEGIARDIEEELKLLDLRSATEGPASFGKWTGIFESTVRAQPPAPGAYECRSDHELGLRAFNALASMGLGRVVTK